MSELLAPAGNPEALDAAIGEGADAVYLGLKSFNARLRSSNFAWNQFEGAVNSLHKMGKKIYVTVNTVCEESETERLYRFLNYLNKVRPDGLIVQDFGVIRMCQEFAPDLELHASTQMNVSSAAAANLLCKQGLKRVVVARELGLEEIRNIKANTNAEIEMFVHGALCVSESGLCLFSSYLGGKSANRGMCTQACRRLYNAEIPGSVSSGYYFSPCDLQLIDHIPELMEAGVDSFKIEGRMKSAEYVGAVTAAYRFVMDHYKEDRKGVIAEGKRILSTDFARSKTDYWYGFKNIDEGVSSAGEKILNPKQAGGTGIYLGKLAVTRESTDSERKISEAGRPEPKTEEERRANFIQMAVIKGGSYDPDAGDSIRLHKKDDTGRASHKVRVITTDEKGNRWIDIPLGFSQGDSVYLLQTKSMSKRYKRVLPVDLTPYRKQPGPERLPVLDLTPLSKNELNWFPEGIYVQVSTVADAHVVQALHPVRYILELNADTEYDLLNKDTAEKPVLPFSKKMVIISLDPFVPSGKEAELRQTLDTLIEKGYTTFIANNLAHLAMLRGKKANVIAGQYLYTFNRWAVSFLENQNVMAVETPVENSERNLEKTFESASERSRVLLSVFAYPALFRLRFKLPSAYDFTYFSDKEQMTFKVNSTSDGSFVMPEYPFSLVDKMVSLKNRGWTHQLIDFSRTKVTRSDIKNLMTLMNTHQPVQGGSRFNWKDGFYDPEKIEAYQQSAARREQEEKSGNRRPLKNSSRRPSKKNKRK
ncbi:peptidase U32 family protein [Treponema sp.]|uniref:peptidase U32 family protein n=1 Tax=Treponema sp. TaxID=166 RepID=UPI0025E1A9CB|nr:peptidase U32 family protein [Treponema sp.]MCR5218580.1 U32 family peptidase [Treponema sp.]